MPISVQIIGDKYTVLNCEEEVCVDDFVKANKYIYSKVDERIARYQIVDLTHTTSLVLSTEDIERIANQDKNAKISIGPLAIAVVAAKDLDYGLSRMWEAYADTSGIQTMVFKDLVTSEEWILRMRDKHP